MSRYNNAYKIHYKGTGDREQETGDAAVGGGVPDAPNVPVSVASAPVAAHISAPRARARAREQGTIMRGKL